MPFKSEAQRRKFWAMDPEMAARWEADTPKGKKLPERVGGPRRSPKRKSAKDIAPRLVNRSA